MLNIEKYKKEIIAFAKGKYSDLTLLQLFMANKTGINYKEILNTQVLDWLTEEYKEPILDEAEKEYLRSVIKPFRNRIRCICLDPRSFDYYQIRIVLTPISQERYTEVLIMPTFKKDTMYKRMKFFKEYSLEELGL